MTIASARTAWILLIGGLAGWLAALVLTIERFALFADPNYKPSCSVNPILSCGSVMKTEQAAAFGFPNPIIGVVGFAVVMAVAVLSLMGVGLARRIWGGLWLGIVAGVCFVCWLIFQSLYRINALCPYCMVVWAIITPLLAVVTDQLWGGSRGPLRVLAEWRWAFVELFFAVVLLLVFQRFQDYWLSLI